MAPRQSYTDSSYHSELIRMQVTEAHVVHEQLQPLWHPTQIIGVTEASAVLPVPCRKLSGTQKGKTGGRTSMYAASPMAACSPLGGQRTVRSRSAALSSHPRRHRLSTATSSCVMQIEAAASATS